MLILAAFLPAPAFSADQNISWAQRDLSTLLPCGWYTSDNIIVTATTDLDFSNLSVSPNGINDLIESGDADVQSTLTFTATSGQNYQFININPRVNTESVMFSPANSWIGEREKKVGLLSYSSISLS